MQSTHQAAEGIWQLKESVPVDDDLGQQVNDTVTFIYQGDTVVLRLLTLHAGQWKSADDFYKLSARWQGDTLYYLPPFGDWVRLALFENGRFVDIGNGIKRIFERIAEAHVVKWNSQITAPREAHDYRIQPDGSARSEPA